MGFEKIFRLFGGMAVWPPRIPPALAQRMKLTRTERKARRRAAFGVRAKLDATERIIIDPEDGTDTSELSSSYQTLRTSVDGMVVRRKSLAHATIDASDTRAAIEQFKHILGTDEWISTIPKLVIAQVSHIDAELVKFCRSYEIPIHLGGAAPEPSPETRIAVWMPTWDAAYFPCHNTDHCRRHVNAVRYHVCPACRVSVFCSDACWKSALEGHRETCARIQSLQLSDNDRELCQRLPQPIYSQ